MARVTGIGGVFFKARDPSALKAWYVQRLGFNLEEWGGVLFQWNEDAKAHAEPGVTVWNLGEEAGTWFAPSESRFMVNYRVDDLEALLTQLAAAGIKPVKGPDEEFNGRFAWIMDPEGNKVELWEPA